jgi:hypothetical protein
MPSFKTIGAWIAALALALGFGPLAAEMLRNWMSNNGFLEHPEAGIAWMISVIASVTQYAWFYWTLGAAATLVIAWILWTGIPAYLLRRRTKRLTLANHMRDLAAGIRSRQSRMGTQWPDNVRDIRPHIDTCILDAKRAGLYAPPASIFSRGDGVRLLYDYLHFVGIYISEGHWAEAKKRAYQLKDELAK